MRMQSRIDLRRLPPLNALKGFEATTRRQSVREAADELCLTHSAISHQLQLLEGELGVQLFSREGRSIVPTAEGRLLYPFVRQAFETLIEGAATVRRARPDQPLRVQTYVTASIRWLAHRIPAFLAAHPDINLLLTTCGVEWGFDESLADLGLVYCETVPEAAFSWTPLFDYVLYPVCSPALRARLGARPGPKDLLDCPLVTIYTEAKNWETWFESAGIAYAGRAALVVDTLAVALEIALDGSAVVLVNGPFDDAELIAGRLVRPVTHQLKCPGAWGLICRQDKRADPRIRAFIEWLTALAVAA